MNIIITRALNMEFEEKDLAAKVFHGKKDKLLYILELSYKKYYNLLYNYGLKLTNDSELVQDFIQEIFTKLCKRENIDNISNIKIYLLRAMRNIIYDYYAAQKDIVSIDDMEFLIPDDAEVFKTFFSKNDEELQKYQTLLQTINSLPNQQKQILYGYQSAIIYELPCQIYPQATHTVRADIRKIEKPSSTDLFCKYPKMKVFLKH